MATVSNLTGTGNHPSADSIDIAWEITGTPDSAATTYVQYYNAGWVTLYTLDGDETSKLSLIHISEPTRPY